MFDVEQFILNFKHDAKPANYDKWVEHYEDMKVHTRGDVPHKLIEQVFPNEPKEFHDFRINNYRPITKGSMLRAVSDLHSFLHDANYDYTISDILQDYLKTKVFSVNERENLDYWQYLSKLVLRRMIEDPNGLLVWLPSDIIASNSKVEVEPLMVECYDIHTLTSEAVCYLSEEKSEVIVSGKREMKGKVYHLFTNDAFFKVEQFGEQTEQKYQLIFIYKHDIGTPPVIVFGGEEINGYFESYFAGFLPFANEAIIQFQQHQVSMLRCGFPHIEEAVSDCNATGCDGGRVFDRDNDVWNSCHKCSGTGKLVLRSPLGTYQRSTQRGLLEGDTVDNTPMVRFHAPDTAILNVQREAYKDYLEAAEKALSLNPPVDIAQSGIAKEYDRQEKYAMKVKISNNYFDNIYFNSLWFIEKYRNISNPIQPVIFKPTDFDIETEADLLNKMKELNESKAPTPFIVESIKSLARKSFSNSEIIQKVIDVISDYDVLFGIDEEAISLKMASGIVDNITAIKHTYAYKVINRIATDNQEFFLTANYAALEAKIDAEMAKYLPKTGNIMQLPGMDIIDNQPLDIEMEAAAKLRGTVGGADVIQSYAEKVKANVIDYDAAIAGLIFLFKIDETEAKKLLGDKNELENGRAKELPTNEAA